MIAMEVIKELDYKNSKIVFTNGCFDVLHYGHIHLLKEAKKLGDILIVGLNSDSSVTRLKGKSRPFFSQNIRLKVLESIKYVDYVIIFDEDTPLELIKLLLPHVIVKGSDYSLGDIIGKEIIEKSGGDIVIVKRIDGLSTTRIINEYITKTMDIEEGQ